MAAPWSLGVRVRIIGKLHGQDCINVYHFATNTVVNDAPSTDALILALLTAFLLCITDQLLAAVTSDYKLTGVEGTAIFPTKGDPIFLAADPGAQGALSPTSTSFIATLVQIRTGIGGRTHRGRNFLPPAGEANTANSVLDADTKQQLIAFVNCVIGKFMGQNPSTDWRLGVWSRKGTTKTDTKFNENFTQGTSMIVNEVSAVMGTRKVGRGS